MLAFPNSTYANTMVGRKGGITLSSVPGHQSEVLIMRFA
jgi:hypothetical protein